MFWQICPKEQQGRQQNKLSKLQLEDKISKLTTRQVKHDLKRFHYH